MSLCVRGALGTPGRLRRNTETVLRRSNRPWHAATVRGGHVAPFSAGAPRPTVGHKPYPFKSQVCLECDDIASWRVTRHTEPYSTS